ncbi:MAG: aminotransferase class V-fold PLP-dependent enzyme, partial [Bdellovibrionales bacterium]|nr:aminotransferase class V-fold PLP-dependent enzyme [Bdellovibrionales bacterium]
MMIKMPDWEKERLQYPALQNQTYLMTAAAGPLSQAVYESYQRHFKELYENGDIHWLLNLDSIETSRRGAMSFIGAHCESEVAFTGNTSLTMNLFAMSFKSLLHSQNRELSVLTCKEEFPSTSLPWIHHGYKIHQVEARNLADALRERNPSIVLTSTVQYGTGFRQNLNQLGELCQQKSYFIVNATQSLGAFPLDVKKSRVTALSASCHKWMGCGFGICLL